MKISIITASFNNEKTLEQCILSVISQKNVNVQHVIVDGGSTDGSLQILEKYKSKIDYISEPDKGIYDALNKGINLANGEIIGTLGADDFYPDKNTLSFVEKAFESNQIDALYGDKEYVDQNNTKVVRYWKAGDYFKSNWLKGWMPPHLSFYIKKENFDKFGKYNPAFKRSGDYELMLRMLYKNGLEPLYLPKVLVKMRTGGISNGSISSRIKANLEDRKAWEINNIKPKFYTLYLKPLSKIFQFFVK